MNPTTKTVQDNIKEYDDLRRNPMANAHTMSEIKKSFDLINLNSLSPEEQQILFAD